jgi:hypothetical protein
MNVDDSRRESNPGSANTTDEDASFDPVQLEAEASANGEATKSTPEPLGAPNIYDPAFLGLTQDFAAEAQVAKKWEIIKVEKPSKSRVFRVHPDPNFRVKTILLSLKEDNEVYVVLPHLRGALADEGLCGKFTLFACITKAGTPFLWPIRMADADGKWNPWHSSAWGIAEKAQLRWTRMQANREAGHYMAEYDQRPPELQREPEWPTLTFAEWLELALKGFTIDSIEHPVLKRLRMED